MGKDPKKVVNTEEQNRTVNPGDKNYGTGDTSADSPVVETQEVAGEMEKADGASEVDQPYRLEGDDASAIERNFPNL